MIRVHELKLSIDAYADAQQMALKLQKKLGLPADAILYFRVIKESIDARKGVVFSYSVDVACAPEVEARLIKKGFAPTPHPYLPLHERICNEKPPKSFHSPVVVGYGPAGIFAALELAHLGLRPLVLEKGAPADMRAEDVDAFWETGVLNTQSNVQFGEGGAGTFSDGKLTTRIKDRRVEWILEQLIQAGAPEDIRYKNKPHLGTDRLRVILPNLRRRLEGLGGTVRFHTEVSQLISDSKGCIKGVITAEGEHIASEHVLLAVGHSARSFFEALEAQRVAMEPKPFAVGVRVEHPQVLIDAAQYGHDYTHPRLRAAEYKLSHRANNGRSVYSFCMCPGGHVVASASEQGGVVVNGMSYYARDAYNANSALLVGISPEDYGGRADRPLAGMYFQRQIEARAFQMGGGQFAAPSEGLKTYLKSPAGSEGYCAEHCKQFYATYGIDYESAYAGYAATYRPDTVETGLDQVLPAYMHTALREALSKFGKIIPGFDAPEVRLTAVESRSSSPVRLIRNSTTLESVSHKGLYPCGEGAGYAGGITSSAVDGLKSAEAIGKALYAL